MHLRPKNQSVQLFLGSTLVWESLGGIPLLSVPCEKKKKKIAGPNSSSVQV